MSRGHSHEFPQLIIHTYSDVICLRELFEPGKAYRDSYGLQNCNCVKNDRTVGAVESSQPMIATGLQNGLQ